MKTKIYLSFSAITLLFFATACQSSSDKKSEGSNDSTTSSVDKQQETKTATTTFKHTIPLDAIKAMVSTYETERVGLINNNAQLRKAHGENFVDSKNGWIPLEELISFVEEVKASGKNSGLSTKDIGVRFYYTVYPEAKDGESEYFKGIEKEYRSRQTFLLLPTYHDKNSNTEKDILSPLQASSKSKTAGKDQGAAASDNDGNTGTPQYFSAPSGGAVALNHMALCPPACTD